MQTRRMKRPIVWAACTVLAGCGGDGSGGTGATPVGPGAAPVAAAFDIVSGNDQMGKPGEALPDRIVVELRDASGTALTTPGATVTWAIRDGSGSLQNTTTESDASGRASNAWTLGPGEGLQTIEIRTGSASVQLAHARSIDRFRPIVFTSSREPFRGDFDLFMMEPDGSDVIRLTATPERERGPVWSPDGTKIAFFRATKQTCDTQQADIVILDVTSRVETQITQHGACDWSDLRPAWSPDGAWIATDVSDQIVVMRSDGSDRKVIATGRNPSWSPDGREIVYDYRAGGQAARQPHAIRPDGSGDRVLTDDRSAAFGAPLWSPKDERIAVFRRPVESAGFESISMAFLDVEDGKVTGVDDSIGWVPTGWSSDGKQLLVSQWPSSGPCGSGASGFYGHVLLWILDVETGDRTQLTTDCRTNALASWRPAR